MHINQNEIMNNWLETIRLYVQFIDDIDNLKKQFTLYCSVWNEIKNWIELNIDM